jgi:hypothetical protein
MAKRTVELDDSIFQHKIRTLAKKWGVDEKEFVREQGALFLNDVGRFVPPYKTFPFGKRKSMGTKADHVAGKLAIEYDLKKLFFVPEGNVYLWAEKQFMRGQVYKGKKIIGAGVLKSIDEMRIFHNKHRNPRTGRPRPLKGFEQMWVSKSLFNKYFKLQIQDVGIAKASIAKGVLALNASAKIPAWIKKQMPKAAGGARMAKIGKSWTAVFNAKAFGLQHVKDKTIRIVQKGRMKAMENRLKHIFKQTAKQSGWKVR